jgi:hypothetical protein
MLRRDVSRADDLVRALDDVMERFAGFSRLGALYGEGGERAFRGWLITRLLMDELRWPWSAVVNGESLDVLLVDWSDRGVVYVETKTPTETLKPKHRLEVASRLDRWPTLVVAVLTNGHEWERYDEWTTPLRAGASFKRGEHPTKLSSLLAPLRADRHLPLT